MSIQTYTDPHQFQRLSILQSAVHAHGETLELAYHEQGRIAIVFASAEGPVRYTCDAHEFFDSVAALAIASDAIPPPAGADPAEDKDEEQPASPVGTDSLINKAGSTEPPAPAGADPAQP